MSPIVFIVFAPVAVIVVAFYALLLGAAAAGVCEAVEQRSKRRPTASGQAPSPKREYTRAA